MDSVDYLNIQTTFVEPKEYVLPTPFWQRVFTTSLVGAAIGTGAGFIKAGDIQALFSGVLLRYAAIGTLIASGVGLLYPLIPWIYARCRERSDYTDPASYNPKIERIKAWYRPSTSPLYSWDLRVFLAAQGAGVLGAAIASYIHPVIGEMLGMGMGAIAGTFFALLYHPPIAHFLARVLTFLSCCCSLVALKNCIVGKVESKNIKRSHWYTPSRHDVPWCTRLFFGAWTGYVIGSVVNNPGDANYELHRLIATSITAGVALLSPILMAACHNKEKANTFDDKVAWYREVPWYARAMPGVIASLTLAARVQSYLGKPAGNIGYWIGGGMLPFLSPLLFAIISGLNDRCCAKSANLRERQPIITGYPISIASATPRLSIDMPWYFRIALGIVGGAMLGDAIQYRFALQGDVAALITTSVIGGLAMLSPIVLSRFTKDSEKADLKMPWYGRLLAGAWAGVMLGSALGNLIPSLSSLDVVPGTIGPEFLMISNEVGAPTGALIGAGVAVFLPLIFSACKWAREKYTKPHGPLPDCCLTLFRYCRSTNREGGEQALDVSGYRGWFVYGSTY